MKILSFLLLQAALNGPQADEPRAFSDTHIRAIGCVAIIGLVADQQKRGRQDFNRYSDLNIKGPKFAADIGQHVIEETGQTREVVAFAMQESAREQWHLLSPEHSKELTQRMETCLPLLNQVTLEKRTVTAADYRQCAAIISLLIDRGNPKFVGKDALYLSLLDQYREEKYAKTRNAMIFARTDVLKEKTKQGKNASFSENLIDQCLEIGS